MHKGKMNKDRMIEEYKDYLRDEGMTEGSINSYYSYLNSACKYYFDLEYGKDTLEWIASLKKPDRVLLVDTLMQVLDIEQFSTNSKTNSSTMNNYRSGMNKFRYYIYDAPFKGSIELPAGFNIPEDYYKKTIEDNFVFRLNTQDRFYKQSKICFPTRLFDKLYHSEEDKTYKKALERLVRNTKFLVSEDKKFIKMRGITKIKITDDEVIITTRKGEEKTLYTEVFQGGESKGYEPLAATELKHLSLDHETPLSVMLKRNSDLYPQLLALSSDYLDFKKMNNISSNSKVATRYYNAKVGRFPFDKEELLEEVLSIYEKIQLVIMQSSYNSSKNDNL